jgi:hypothetical protein
MHDPGGPLPRGGATSSTRWGDLGARPRHIVREDASSRGEAGPSNVEAVTASGRGGPASARGRVASTRGRVASTRGRLASARGRDTSRAMWGHLARDVPRPRPEDGQPRREDARPRPEVGQPRAGLGAASARGRPALRRGRPASGRADASSRASCHHLVRVLSRPRPEDTWPRAEVAWPRPEVAWPRPEVAWPHALGGGASTGGGAASRPRCPGPRARTHGLGSRRPGLGSRWGSLVREVEGGRRRGPRGSSGRWPGVVRELRLDDLVRDTELLERSEDQYKSGPLHVLGASPSRNARGGLGDAALPLYEEAGSRDASFFVRIRGLLHPARARLRRVRDFLHPSRVSSTRDASTPVQEGGNDSGAGSSRRRRE